MEKDLKKYNGLKKFELLFSILFITAVSVFSSYTFINSIIAIFKSRELVHSNNGYKVFFGIFGVGATTLVFFLAFFILILAIVFTVLLIASYKHRNDNTKTYNVTSIIFLTISFIYIGGIFSFYFILSKTIIELSIMILAQLIVYIPLFITKLMGIIYKNKVIG